MKILIKVSYVLLVYSSVLFAQNGATLDELNKLSFDSTTVYQVTLKDKSAFYCLADSLTDNSLFAKSLFKKTLVLPVNAIVSINIAEGEWRNGKFFLFNPQSTRMIFMPTGKTLPAGKILISYTQLFYPVLTYSPFKFLDIGAGFSIVPFMPQKEHMFYAKLLLYEQKGFYASVGGMYTSSEEDHNLAPFVSITMDNDKFLLNIGGGGRAFFNSSVVSAGVEFRTAEWNSLLVELLALPESDYDYLAFSSRLRKTDYAADVGFIIPWKKSPLERGLIPWLTFYYYF